MAIISPKTGKTLTSSQIKASIKSVTGWSDREYKKQYDLIRNKLRNYQKITGNLAGETPQEFLYKTTHTRARYGKNYVPSGIVAAVEATTSASTGRIKVEEKTRKISGISESRLFSIVQASLSPWRGLINASKTAQDIVSRWQSGEINPRQMIDELKKYGNTLNAQRKARSIEGFEASVIYE